MSDIRFVMIGVGLTFAGFIIMGALGGTYAAATFEQGEFGTCYEYSQDEPPREIDCSYKVLDQAAFFGVVVGLIGGGVAALVKGARGDWDSRTRPEEMAGPGGKKA